MRQQWKFIAVSCPDLPRKRYPRDPGVSLPLLREIKHALMRSDKTFLKFVSLLEQFSGFKILRVPVTATSTGSANWGQIPAIFTV